MAKRRQFDDEDERPRRRKKRKEEDDKRPILALLLIGFGVLVLLAVGTIVIVRVSSSREKTTAKGTSGTTGGRPGPGPAAGSSAPIAGELVTNGSFEEGPEPDPAGPGFTPIEAGSTVIPGWTVTRGSVDYIGPYWQHADGKRSIDLNGNEPGAIAQTIRTRAGKRYRVTFSLAGNNCGDADTPKRAVVVSAAGSQAEFTFDTTGKSYEDMGWVTKTWEFTATAAETTLEFTSATEIPPACGPALDRVSVVEIGG
jgi:choice-of-anchor C domain-containing protein